MKQTKLVIILSILTALFLVSTLAMWRLYASEKSAKDEAVSSHQSACVVITQLKKNNETLREEATGLIQSVDSGTVKETMGNCK